jgi:Spy/CpxP family protein refolding chaperone
VAKTWQIILATIAIFVAGLVTGGATAFGLVRWSRNHRQQQPANPYGARAGQPQPFGPQLMRNFAKQLDLTDAQRAQIEPIVKRTAGELGRQRREVQLTTALAIEKMQDQIAGLLTPDQKTKFEDLIAKQRAKFNELREQNRAYMQGLRTGQGAGAN